MRAIVSFGLAAAFCVLLACDSDTIVNVPADAALSEGPVRVTLVVDAGGPNGGTIVSPGTYRFVARLNTHADSLVESFVVR